MDSSQGSTLLSLSKDVIRYILLALDTNSILSFTSTCRIALSLRDWCIPWREHVTRIFVEQELSIPKLDDQFNWRECARLLNGGRISITFKDSGDDLLVSVRPEPRFPAMTTDSDRAGIEVGPFAHIDHALLIRLIASSQILELEHCTAIEFALAGCIHYEIPFRWLYPKSHQKVDARYRIARCTSIVASNMARLVDILEDFASSKGLASLGRITTPRESKKRKSEGL